MPRPKRLGRHRIAWDVRALDFAVDRLPTEGDDGTVDITGRMSMPRKLPPFVECWRDRHGKIRVYFRQKKGPRIRLPSSVGSNDFNAEYLAALAGNIAVMRERRRPDQPNSIAALITSYMRSASYLALRQTTKAGYTSRIEVLRTKHGHRTVSGLTRERIVTGILQPYADRPGAALSILKMLRVLIRHAIDIGWLKHDPSLGIKRPKTGKFGHGLTPRSRLSRSAGRSERSSGLHLRSCSTADSGGAMFTG